jgi:hypothetical protein
MSFPAIPTPKNDVDSLYKSVMALKQCVEQIVTDRGPGQYPNMFVQKDTPTAAAASDGDFWLQSGIKTTLSILINGKWLLVGNLV